jgi:hypothetical protein
MFQTLANLIVTFSPIHSHYMFRYDRVVINAVSTVL